MLVQCWFQLTECPCGPYGYIITELCEFSLNLWLQSTQVTNMSDEEWDRQVPVLMTDMLSGLNHLHTNNPVILHRDIKVCIGAVLLCGVVIVH